MSDPLSVLRTFLIDHRPIGNQDGLFIFDDVAWPKETLTNYRAFDWVVKDPHHWEYYTLECLIYFVQNAGLNHPAYVDDARRENIPFIRRPDRKNLLAYLTNPASDVLPKNIDFSLEGSSCLKQPFVIPKRKLEEHVAGDGPAPVDPGQVGEGDSDPKRRKISESHETGAKPTAGEPEGPPDGFKDCGPLNSAEDVRGLHSLLFCEQLPEELLSKFWPTKCDLCSVDLASPSGKKYHHYNGNPHRKSVTKFMQSLGLPAPTRRKPESAGGPVAVVVVPDAINVVAQLVEDDVRELHSHLFYEQLPEELLTKFLATKCDLCFVDFTSPNGAKSHYYGNPHRKTITKFMLNIGLPGPTRKTDQQVPDALAQLQPDQDIRYCHLCKIDLTSEIVAMSHYAGKNHAKKRRAFDAQNAIAAAGGPQEQPQQWQAEQQVHVPGPAAETKSSTENGNKGQQISSFFCMPCQMHFKSSDEYTVHFCSDEHKAQCAANNLTGNSESQNSGSELGVAEMLSRIRSDPNSPFECGICNVRTTGEDNFRMHLAGKNHKKKLAQQAGHGGGLQQPVAVGGGVQHPVAAVAGVGLQQPVAAVVKPAIGDPWQVSSPYRCEYCQVTTTDLSTLALHLKGKKHAKKLADLGIEDLSSSPANTQ